MPKIRAGVTKSKSSQVELKVTQQRLASFVVTYACSCSRSRLPAGMSVSTGVACNKKTKLLARSAGTRKRL